MALKKEIFRSFKALSGCSRVFMRKRDAKLFEAALNNNGFNVTSADTFQWYWVTDIEEHFDDLGWL